MSPSSNTTSNSYPSPTITPSASSSSGIDTYVPQTTSSKGISQLEHPASAFWSAASNSNSNNSPQHQTSATLNNDFSTRSTLSLQVKASSLSEQNPSYVTNVTTNSLSYTPPAPYYPPPPPPTHHPTPNGMDLTYFGNNHHQYTASPYLSNTNGPGMLRTAADYDSYNIAAAAAVAAERYQPL